MAAPQGNPNFNAGQGGQGGANPMGQGGSSSPPPSPPGLGRLDIPLGTNALYVPDLSGPIPPDDPFPVQLQKFLDPPAYHYNADRTMVFLDIHWAQHRFGFVNFEYDTTGNAGFVGEWPRRVLSEDSEVLRDALREGMHPDILAWLKGFPPTEEFWIPVEKLRIKKPEQ